MDFHFLLNPPTNIVFDDQGALFVKTAPWTPTKAFVKMKKGGRSRALVFASLLYAEWRLDPAFVR